jgi:hypothetical protein
MSAARAEVLDETTFAEAARDPDFMRATGRSVNAIMEIGAYGVACIESGR